MKCKFSNNNQLYTFETFILNGYEQDIIQHSR